MLPTLADMPWLDGRTVVCQDTTGTIAAGGVSCNVDGRNCAAACRGTQIMSLTAFQRHAMGGASCHPYQNTACDGRSLASYRPRSGADAQQQQQHPELDSEDADGSSSSSSRLVVPAMCVLAESTPIPTAEELDAAFQIRPAPPTPGDAGVAGRELLSVPPAALQPIHVCVDVVGSWVLEAASKLANDEHALAERDKAVTERERALRDGESKAAEREKALRDKEKRITAQRCAMVDQVKKVTDQQKLLRDQERHVMQLQSSLRQRQQETMRIQQQAALREQEMKVCAQRLAPLAAAAAAVRTAGDSTQQQQQQQQQ